MPLSGQLQQIRDQKLVKKMLAGNERAIKTFIDDYFPRLYRYASHRLSNEADVEEVVSTTLSEAARHIGSFRGESTLLTWLIQICRHEISRSLRKTNQHADLMLNFLDDDLLRSIVESIEADTRFSPEADYRRTELITLIQFALDQLPEHYAQVLELKYVEGYDSKEIAAQLSTSDQAVQSLLARARQAFKEVCGEALRNLFRNNDEPAF